MQNSYQQTPYSGNQAYMSVPAVAEAQGSYASSPDPEKVQMAPANFHPSPNKDSIYLPILKRRVARKTFWIIVGVVGGVVLIAIIAGIAVGVTNANKSAKGRGGKGGKSSGHNSGGGGGGGGSGDGGYGNDAGDYGTDTGDYGTDGDYGDYTNDSGSSDYDTSSGGGGGGDSGGSTDPCQDLVDAGAPWDAISDCMYQQHTTTMEIIDNFDSSDDYTYTYTYNPYSSTGNKETTPHKKLDKAGKAKLGAKLDLGAHKLGGKPEKFHGKLGGTKPAHNKHPLASAGNTLTHVKPTVGHKQAPKANLATSATKLHIPKPENLPAVKARSEKFGGKQLEAAYQSLRGRDESPQARVEILKKMKYTL